MRRVAVVGAGPIGLAAAIALGTRGADVVVFETRHPPLDKPCGEGILPDGWRRLERLGVDPAGHSIGGIRYRAPGVVVDAPFATGPGKGVRRLELHAALVRRAEEAGVEIRWGTKVASASAEGVVETSHSTEGFDVVLAADGLRSRARQQHQLERPGGSLARFGVRTHFAVAPRDDRVEVWWTPEVEAYVTPVGPDAIGVALLTATQPVHFDRLLQRFPALVQRLAGAERLGPVLGTGPLEQRVRRRVAGRLVLIGDAAGYLDAITGEGISLGLHQVELLVAALERGGLRTYERRVRSAVRRADLPARLWLLTATRPRLRDRALASLARHPDCFAGLLAAHADGHLPRPGDLLMVLASLARRSR